jgi:hypothetical protein
MKTIKIAAFSLFLAIAAAAGALTGQTADSGLAEHLKNLEFLESSIQ